MSCLPALASLLFLSLLQEPAQEGPETRPAPPDPKKLQAEGRTEEALVQWRRLVAAKPGEEGPSLGLTSLLLELGRFQEAIEATEAGLRAFPESLELVLACAQANLQRAQELMARRADPVEVRMHLEEAVTRGEAARELDDSRREALAIIGMATFKLGQEEATLEAAELLVKRFPRYQGGHFLRGEVFFHRYLRARQEEEATGEERLRLHGEARKSYQEALRLDPGRPLPYRKLGDLFFLEKQRKRAFELWARGLARDPGRGAPSPAWLGENTTPIERLALHQKAAKKHAELGTKPVRDRADLHWGAGLAAWQTKKWKLVGEEMAKAFQLKPSYLNCLYYQGLASWELEDFDAALPPMARFAERTPAGFLDLLKQPGGKALSEKLKYLADLAFRKGALLASRHLNRVLAEYRNDAGTWNNYAFLCRETRAYEESFRSYKRALAHTPEDPNLLNDCALILQYHLHRDLDQARAMYEKALASARRILKDGKASPEKKASARQAISDATGNLRELDRGRKGGKGSKGP